MLVAPLISGRDAGDVDVHLDRGLLGYLGDLDLAAELGETTPDLGEAQVPAHELDCAVRGVDRVGARGRDLLALVGADEGLRTGAGGHCSTSSDVLNRETPCTHNIIPNNDLLLAPGTMLCVVEKPDERRLAAWRNLLASHAALVDRLSEELQEEKGLPLPWYEVLLFLAQAPDGRLRMGELAGSLLLTASCSASSAPATGAGGTR